MAKGKQQAQARSRNRANRAQGQTTSKGQNHLVPYNAMMTKTDSLQITAPTDQVYIVRRSYVDASVVQSSTGVTFNSRNFTLAQIGDATNLAAVFDQYKILAAEVQYTPRGNVNNVNSSNTNLGRLYTVADYDDSNNLTSVAQATNYDNMIVSENWQPQRRCIKPRQAIATYSGAFTSFANVGAMWNDVASPSIQHYGLKEVIEQGTLTALAVFDVTVTLLLALRASR